MRQINTITTQKVKDFIEYAKKSSEILNLRQQCREIRNHERNKISKKVIDDAFDAFGIIVKTLSTTPKEELELQKLCTKYFLSEFIRTQGVEITI